MNPLRLGIVGPGLIWENAHRPALAELPDTFAVSAFCAGSERSREKIAAQWPGTPFYRDYHALAAAPEVDALLVLTPIALNTPVAIAALRAGKDVFLEKPIARSLAEGEELARVAAETGRQVYVLEQYAYRTWAPVQQALAAGAIGELVAYEYTVYRLFDTGEHSQRGYGTTAWRVQPDFPLGTLWDGGHHQVATLSRLFGPPQRLYASGHRVRPEYGDYDHIAVLMEYAAGFHGTFNHSELIGGGRNYFHIRGTAGVLSIYDDRLERRHPEGHLLETVTLPDEDQTANMWHSLAEDVATGRTPRYTLADALGDLRTLDAIDRAIRTRGSVAL